MKVQIVVKTKEEAMFCFKNDADAVAVIVRPMHTCNDAMTAELAREIIAATPPFCCSTLLTHLEESKEIIEILKITYATCIQLHSYIKEAEVRKIKEAFPYLKIIRLIHIDVTGKPLNKLPKDFIGDAIFLDSINKKTDQFGGTGLVHNWKKSAQIVEESKVPVCIGGGLTPENVREAIRVVKPYCVDVNTGCKGSNGLRDYGKVVDFINNAKRV